MGALRTALLIGINVAIPGTAWVAAGSSAGDAAAALWAVVALWWLAQVVALAAMASSGSQNGPATGPTGTQPHPGTAADGTLPVGPTDD
jgi:hypothetical protein